MDKSHLKDLKGIEIFTNLNYLSCGGTGITSLDVSNNPNLIKLYCSNTAIASLDVNNNPSLETLNCDKTGITSLDVSNNLSLKELSCRETGIANLNVRKNINLKYLYCEKTAIANLDISENTSLEYLNCFNTGITSLDVSNNPNLMELECNDTGITSLNINNNPSLETLDCSNTAIASLDVSNNPNLIFLDCSNTAIASLDINNNLMLDYLNISELALTYLNIRDGLLFPLNTLIKDNPKTTDIYITRSTFDIKELDNRIDSNKITDITGATLDKATGIMSNIVAGTPIVYTYDCGELTNGQKVLLTVKLMPFEKIASTMTINKDLNKTYDGKKVALKDSDITVTGSTGAITYKWEVYNGTQWVACDIPMNAGKYRVTATVSEDDNFATASAIKEFEIEKIASTMTINKDLNKTYDGKKVELKDSDITVTGSTGAITYKWEMYNGTQWVACDIPMNAGKYRVTATVAEDDNYTTSSTTKEFIIEKGKEPVINNDSNDKDKVVGTGDNQQTGIFAVLGTISLGVMALISGKKRNREIDHD